MANLDGFLETRHFLQHSRKIRGKFTLRAVIFQQSPRLKNSSKEYFFSVRISEDSVLQEHERIWQDTICYRKVTYSPFSNCYWERDKILASTMKQTKHSTNMHTAIVLENH